MGRRSTQRASIAASVMATVGSVIGAHGKSGTVSALRQHDMTPEAENQKEKEHWMKATDANDLRNQMLQKKGDTVLLEGVLQKRIQLKEISWQERYVTLTDEALLFALESGGEIRDAIRLSDISSCTEVTSDNAENLIFKTGA